MNTENDSRIAIVSRIRVKEEHDDELSESKLEARKELIELEGRTKFFLLRDRWSHWIIVWISVFIAFHIALTVSIGLKWLDFQTHVWLVPSIIMENFLQVVGMGYVVIKFLYPPDNK